MFDLDKWQEILSTMRTNKLRTALTGFSVAWGIFMLVILLGAGTGLENGVRQQFNDDASNSMWLYSGQTSVAYQGLKKGRLVQFELGDVEALEEQVDEVLDITARYYIPTAGVISYGGKSGTFSVRCVHPAHAIVENSQIVEGRFLNPMDLEEFRKVIVIGDQVRRDLFGDSLEAVGQLVTMDKIVYKVIGVFTDSGSSQEQETVYLPITTAQRIYGGDNVVNQIIFTIDAANTQESKAVEEQVRQVMATQHNFDPADTEAMFVRNMVENFENVMALFMGIRVFVWVIGIGTIVAGVVGVSNIMMIVVKERTKEIGIRKALGATPASVVGLVVLEAVLITSVAGYLGLVAGVGLLELVAANMPPSDFFLNPGADFRLALGATLLLVASGSLAGLVPALKAAAIRPIVALREE